jgi:hypothetical protein
MGWCGTTMGSTAALLPHPTICATLRIAWAFIVVWLMLVCDPNTIEPCLLLCGATAWRAVVISERGRERAQAQQLAGEQCVHIE